MLPINRAVSILKSKSGVSLIFVLGIMMMLFAMGGAVMSRVSTNVDIGSSVMGSATANFGSNIRQNQYNSAVVLSESIHRTIKESLLTNEGSPNYDNSLAKKLPEAIYEVYDADGNFGTGFTFALSGAEVTNAIDLDYRISIIFPQPNSNPGVTVQDPIPPMPELGIPRTPATVTVNAEIIIRVVIDLPGGNGRSITTLATYEYRDGVLSDENDPSTATTPELVGTLEFVGYGEWELVSYEMIESD